jgi:flagellar protein FliO/FliZ
MQDLLVTWFGATGATVVRYVVALAVVIGLLLLLRWVLRNYATGGQLSIGRSRQNHRLTIVEQIALDQRRRLLLVKRDGVEHLILVGGGNDLVVEPTIIRGVPVGSLGRGTRPAAPSSPTAAEEAEHPAVDTPAVATPAFVPVVEPSTATTRPAPAQRPVPNVEPIRPAFPSHVAGEHPKATSIQARLNRVPPRTSDAARGAPASPYIPPEAHRVEPTVSAISAIVPDKPVNERSTQEAPQAERKMTESPRNMPTSGPAPVTDEGPGFDDLARQLDEALKSEIEDMKNEAAAPAIEPPAPVAPEPAPKPEPPKSAQSAASAWLRPRAAQPPRPIVPREPMVPREPLTPREPAAPVAQQRSPVRPPVVVEPRAVEPPAEAVAAPEPVVTPRQSDKPADKPEDDAQNSADFSSLENEMARLLDELAGDSKGKR